MVADVSVFTVSNELVQLTGLDSESDEEDEVSLVEQYVGPDRNEPERVNDQGTA